MDIIIFSHPEFLDHQSMPRYTTMLSEGLIAKGHNVQVWYPIPKALKLAFYKPMEKWLGYIDQYVFFPQSVKNKIETISKDTLFVFMDHALGPWVHLVSNRPHVIHCHDFLAQRSALGEIKEHKTGWTGRLYQKMIRNGFSQGKHFISVSQKTKEDLHRFLAETPKTSEVIYNGFNQKFAPANADTLRENFSKSINTDLTNGFILHVGASHWYKNRTGVIEIYNAFRENYEKDIPLLLLGNQPDEALEASYDKSPFKNDIHFLIGRSDNTLKEAYVAATLLLFPSYEEGFGWPIAEAMASGCLVVTTNEAPMTEVADSAGFYISRSPGEAVNKNWAIQSAGVVNEVINLSPDERKLAVIKGLDNVKRFNQENTINRIETTYIEILKKYSL